MPSAARDEPVIPSFKKRRRDDASSVDVHLPLYAPMLPGPMILDADYAFGSAAQVHGEDSIYAVVKDNHARIFHANSGPERSPSHGHSPLPRRILPLPVAKKMRIASEADSHMRSRSNSPTIPRHHQQQHKLYTSSTTWREELQQTNANIQARPQQPSPTPYRTAPSSLLRRCHICHRKPAKKADLDSFADCQGCGERTCYVCIRECLGWRAGQENGNSNNTSNNNDAQGGLDDKDQRPGEPSSGKSDWVSGGHRQMVCSRCCVEKGPDGDVVCLGCLPFVDG